LLHWSKYTSGIGPIEQSEWSRLPLLGCGLLDEAICTPMSSKQIELQVASHRRSPAQQVCRGPNVRPLWHTGCRFPRPRKTIYHLYKHSHSHKSNHSFPCNGRLATACLHRQSMTDNDHHSAPYRPFILSLPASRRLCELGLLYALRPMYMVQFSEHSQIE
jgi:hypothetical protein